MKKLIGPISFVFPNGLDNEWVRSRSDTRTKAHTTPAHLRVP